MNNARLWKCAAFSGAVTVFFVLSAVGYGETRRSDPETNMTQATENVQYVLRFVKGQSYDIRIVSDLDASGDRPEDDRAISSQRSIGLGYRFDVNSVDDQGNALVVCTVNRVEYRQKVWGGTPENQDVDHNSSDKSKQTIPEGKGLDEISFVGAKMFRALLDEKFTIIMTPQGRVKEIGGLDTLRKNLAKKATERSAAGQANMAEESMRNMNDVQFTYLFKYYFFRPLAIYPDQLVGIGDTWTINEEIQSGLEQETICILKSRKSSVATIDIDRASRFIIKTGKPDPPVSVSWHFYGQAKIKESTGQILHSQTIETMSAEMSSESQKGRTTITFEMTER